MRILLFLLHAIAFCQEPPKAFEVVSVKPNAASDSRTMIRMSPGGVFTANGATLRMLVGQAYNLRDFQISGAPGWMASDRFDVNARGPEGMPDRMPPEVLRPMLQAMIVDRFELKYHLETKELPVYALTQTKAGHKLKVVEAVAPSPGVGGGAGGRAPQRIMMGRGQFKGESVPMAILIQQLSQVLGRTVIDKTGLPGLYEIDLQWAPDPGQAGGGPGGPPPSGDAVAGADNSGPTLFTALQEKLGLKLDSQKGPVDIMVIDSVSKPAAN